MQSFAPQRVIVFEHVPSHPSPDTVAEARYPNSNLVSCGVGTSRVILKYAYEGHVPRCARHKDDEFGHLYMHCPYDLPPLAVNVVSHWSCQQYNFITI